MDTTFVNRANTNAKVYEEANRAYNPRNFPSKRIRPFREYVEDRQEALLKHLDRAPVHDPLKKCTLHYGNPQP